MSSHHRKLQLGIRDMDDTIPCHPARQERQAQKGTRHFATRPGEGAPRLNSSGRQMR
ncbi:hypothetical protein GCM10028812_35820 [Ancylobacter sonchi]